GKCLPLPMQALVHDGARNVLDALHKLDELVAIGRFAGGKADPAVAHHRGGDTVPRGRRQAPVPNRLAVVMSQNIRDDGNAETIPGLQLFRAVALEAPDGGDASTPYANVAFAASGSGSVDNRSIADDKIEPCTHRSAPLLSSGRDVPKHRRTPVACQLGC